VKKTNYNKDPDEQWRKDFKFQRLSEEGNPNASNNTMLAFVFFFNVGFLICYLIINKTIGFFGYVSIILLVIQILLFLLGLMTKSRNNLWTNSLNEQPSFKSEKVNDKEITVQQYHQTSFDNFIAGRMPLAKMFWLYFVFIGIILSVISGYFFSLDYPIVLIIPVAYYALLSVALWNCATLYTNEKLAQRQSYGWAIGVKIVVVFNIIGTLSQIGLMLSGK